MERQPIPEIRTDLAGAAPARLARLISLHAADERAGVQAAVASARRRLAAIRAENRRLEALARAESELHLSGCTCVAGIDEVGRGALAGPLTAGAVVFPPGVRIVGLDDSKRLKPEHRLLLAEEIRSLASAWHVAHVEAPDLDRMGMTAALRKAMELALAGLEPRADHALVDGRPMGLTVPETAVVGGDGKVAAIAAASILAKVTRDALMRELDAVYPGYDFALNKGYGTAEHMQAIRDQGLSPVHRRSFAPCGGTMTLF